MTLRPDKPATANVFTQPVQDTGSTRFAFGGNWQRFLAVLTDERIRRAEESLQQMLGMSDLAGRSFLDIGCGSALFSLAARRMGANVYSFDFDPQSVACADVLRDRYYPNDGRWRTARGSVLDGEFMRSLGEFDIVYSWGVLHHTGEMWRAVANASERVAAGGLLFLAIYNDQGLASRLWTRVKHTYNRLPRPFRMAYLLAFGGAIEAGAAVTAFARLEPRRLIERWTSYESVRGMSRWHDVVDWVGGYPFEVATPEAVFDFCVHRGFTLIKLKTCLGRMGCNEFVFRR